MPIFRTEQKDREIVVVHLGAGDIAIGTTYDDGPQGICFTEIPEIQEIGSGVETDILETLPMVFLQFECIDSFMVLQRAMDKIKLRLESK